ncbi:hypothetical protein PHET_11285, partial [Paragonimus heterotremus]
MTLGGTEREEVKPLQKNKRPNKQLQRPVTERPTSPPNESIATYLPDIGPGWVNLHEEITEIVASNSTKVNIPTGCCVTPKCCSPSAKRSALDKPTGLVASPDQKKSRPAPKSKTSLPTVQAIERALGQQPSYTLDDLQKNFMFTDGQ